MIPPKTLLEIAREKLQLNLEVFKFENMSKTDEIEFFEAEILEYSRAIAELEMAEFKQQLKIA